jgi:hypothetical protein
MYVYKPVACSISSLSWTPSGNTCKESTTDFQKNKNCDRIARYHAPNIKKVQYQTNNTGTKQTGKIRDKTEPTRNKERAGTNGTRKNGDQTLRKRGEKTRNETRKRGEKTRNETRRKKKGTRQKGLGNPGKKQGLNRLYKITKT